MVPPHGGWFPAQATTQTRVHNNRAHAEPHLQGHHAHSTSPAELD